MITVKQYAEERGITIQAVHQSMKGKRKKFRNVCGVCPSKSKTIENILSAYCCTFFLPK